VEPLRVGGFPLIHWEEGDRGRWLPRISASRREREQRRRDSHAVQSYLTLALSFQ
jgi:hypothetical protein